MTDHQQAVAYAAAWDAYSKLVTQHAKHAREAAIQAVGDREKVTASAEDGTVLGRLDYHAPKPTYGITDMAAFTRWVASRRPHEIIGVNPAFVAWVNSQAQRNGGLVADPETGEVIPGVGRTLTAGGYRLTTTREAVERARVMLGGVLLAIEEGRG